MAAAAEASEAERSAGRRKAPVVVAEDGAGGCLAEASERGGVLAESRLHWAASMARGLLVVVAVEVS